MLNDLRVNFPMQAASEAKLICLAALLGSKSMTSYKFVYVTSLRQGPKASLNCSYNAMFMLSTTHHTFKIMGYHRQQGTYIGCLQQLTR